MKHISVVSLCVLVLLCTARAEARQDGLTVVSTAPQGALTSLNQANEIRVVFSEPMVTLGRVPARVTAPFFSITPAVQGTFRWSGTTVLIFTPDPKRPLPYATEFDVTIAATATAVSGRRLARAETFSFTTPTAQLLQTNWYRRGGTVNGRMVVLLRFNQPMRGADVAAHTTAALKPHEWKPPEFSAEERARLQRIDAAGLAQFDAKVRATRAIAEGDSAIALRLTNDWDKKRFPPARDLVVFETTTVVAPESWVEIALDENLPSPAGSATPEQEQSYTIEGEPAFFIDGFECRAECDADAWNPVRLRSEVTARAFAAALTAVDITAAEQPVARPAAPAARTEDPLDATSALTLEDAGFGAQPPNRKYAVSVRADLQSTDGQTLGYPWVGVVDNWHMRAFTSFGDGHGVWEKDGGALLPFYARNMRDVTQWAVPVQPSELMTTLRALQENNFSTAPPSGGVERPLPVTADRVQSHGLDLTKALKPGGTGLVWTAVREGDLLPRTHSFGPYEPRTRASLVQVTNLGITVKDSPQNTLVFVTRLDTGAPVPGANVSIVKLDSQVAWRGVTGADGVAIAPDTPLRTADDTWRLSFVVTAEKDGDVAYVGSDWNEGISPWEFGTGIDLNEASPLLRGTVFADRGVYRLGEEVHLKAILRHNTPTGIRFLPAGTPVVITVHDSQSRLVDERTIKLTGWSTAEWTMTLPQDGALGTYSLQATLEADRAPKPAGQADAGFRMDQARYLQYRKSVHSNFLVAAYRRPDFRVDVTLGGRDPIAGDELKGVVAARYLFGAPLRTRPVSWRYTKTPGYEAPASITERFAAEQWVFVGYFEREQDVEIEKADAALAANGDLVLDLDTARDAGIPYVYSLEGDVEDVSRQHIANRASVVVHPAPWYIGLRRPPYFVDQKTGLKTEIIAAGLNATLQPGVPVDVTLTQIQWQSVRRAEGNGFYSWETERKEVPAGTWTVTTASTAVPLEIPFKSGGYFVLRATGRTSDGRTALTETSFYVLGDGYTAWARYDHNRIDLVPERKTYKPGDTARIMIQSPWEQATALVTTEREGVRSHRQFALTSTQQSITVPVTENDIPNMFVSVLLVKGRTKVTPAADAPEVRALGSRVEEDPSDPGKPSFRLGYVELKVEDRSKRLTVSVTANQQEYRPASRANVRLDVKDHEGRGAASEVTLWAVDYGVLSLTAYRTPDVLGSVYMEKALQVMNADNRQRIVSRRVLTPKGETDGGDGGGDSGTGTMRKDFRVLAFWIGSVITDANGQATVDVTLPESLTTYRIMAVAGDRASRFGSADTEVRTNKPLTLKPTYPRFLAVGDRARFGAVVTSQLPSAGTATVTMKTLDPTVLGLSEVVQQTVPVPAGGSVEVRFNALGHSVGRARVQMTVTMGAETDAFEDVIPVEVLVSPETVAAYGEAAGATATATETLTIPNRVVPGFGGLHVELASTAMVGLGEGARYLVEYPYGCAEQKGSRALGLLLAADLGDAFTLPGMDTAAMRPAVQQTLQELQQFQCSNGGFGYWPGSCATTSPYLTAYLLHVFKVASDLKYAVDGGMRERASAYLEKQLAGGPPDNDGWWPAYTAWKAFAAKVLVEDGRNQDSAVNRLYEYRDRMPIFALAYLHDAMLARGEKSGARVDDLRRRMSNAILPEAGSAHVEELADPYLLWFWNSNVRSTAIVLNSLVRASAAEAQIRPIVRWMMAARTRGRWGNTQENAHAMEALVNYYRKYEAAVPDFRAVVRLGDEELTRAQFQGRTTESVAKDVPMLQVLGKGPGTAARPLTFTRDGAGTLFYTARLRYAADELYQEGLDAGFRIERRYEPFVDGGKPAPPRTSYAAGDLVRVTLTVRLTKERRFVAVTDPLPAGVEAVESWFATTARDLAGEQDRQSSDDDEGDSWFEWWRRGGFDRVERHDDRVQLFATRLSEGVHEFSYVVRATTAGTFRTAPAHAEEMYEPEVFGRTATAVIEIKQ